MEVTTTKVESPFSPNYLQCGGLENLARSIALSAHAVELGEQTVEYQRHNSTRIDNLVDGVNSLLEQLNEIGTVSHTILTQAGSR